MSHRLPELVSDCPGSGVRLLTHTQRESYH